MAIIDGNGIVGEARVWATKTEYNQEQEINRLKELLATSRKDAMEEAAKVVDAKSKGYANTPHNEVRHVSEIEDMLDDIAEEIRGICKS